MKKVLEFVKVKDTKNKTRFQEVTDDGVASVCETIYVTHAVAGKAKRMTVTIEVHDD